MYSDEVTSTVAANCRDMLKTKPEPKTFNYAKMTMIGPVQTCLSTAASKCIVETKVIRKTKSKKGKSDQDQEDQESVAEPIFQSSSSSSSKNASSHREILASCFKNLLPRLATVFAVGLTKLVQTPSKSTTLSLNWKRRSKV